MLIIQKKIIQVILNDDNIKSIFFFKMEKLKEKKLKLLILEKMIMKIVIIELGIFLLIH